MDDDKAEMQSILDCIAWEKFYSQLLQFMGGAFPKPVRSSFYSGEIKDINHG